MTNASRSSAPFWPQPPQATAKMPWDELQKDPISDIAKIRGKLGDTFAVHSGDTDYLFVFGPIGVRWFYEVEEAAASKGIADWRMLLRKLPDELFMGRRTFPHELFGRDDVAKYRSVLDQAIDDQCTEMGAAGTIDAFALTRRLGHRLGLASWGGRAFTIAPHFDRLVQLFDVLDGSDAFVRPDLTASIVAADKADEREALHALATLLCEIGTTGADTAGFDVIRARWSDEPDANLGAAHDLVLTHIGSMSNLFAAIGWLLIDTTLRPAELATDASNLESWALESVRLAQRSIMMREVLVDELEVVTDSGTIHAARGTTIATLLPLTNTAGSDLSDYRPARWNGRRLGNVDDLAARELVTTFGHGKHTCPAQPFSLYAMTETVRRLHERFVLTPRFETAEPRRVQIGGVARAEAPCPLRYERR